MSRHIPVLLNEVVTLLNLKPGSTIIDGTVGDGGHSEAILQALGPHGQVIGIDADPESLLRAKRFLYQFGSQVTLVHDNFFNLTSITKSQGVASVAGILLDLGWSTPQFEERNRGFSFEGDEYLDMRYDPDEHTETAYDIINTWSLDNLQKLFKNYGEEKLAQEISEAILAARSTHAITTTKELVEIILMVYRKKLKSSREIPWIGGLHPATKVFQALRIQVNRELDRLEQVLPEMVKLLAPGGRLAIITFHSLEDRIVKQYFKKIDHTLVRLVTKKPIVPTSTECTANPRARSAKLRVVEKI